MSRSAFCCRKCQRQLGWLHHGGRLHVASDVTVRLETRGRKAPCLRMTCPACGEQRDYLNGPAVIEARVAPISRAQ